MEYMTGLNCWVKKRVKAPWEYIMEALNKYFLNGDTYVPAGELYSICRRSGNNVTFEVYQRHLAELLQQGILVCEGGDMYIKRTLNYEMRAAEALAFRKESNDCFQPYIVETETGAGLRLCREQYEAVHMALSHHLSIILGGAGCGKTTLVNAIVRNYPGRKNVILCAPTGKAARNLQNRTGLVVRTIHSTLGLSPNDDFLSPVVWNSVGLIIVDEASMMTLEMLAGILCKASSDCHIVLIGDPNQLPSVGSGNVIPDLLQLGFPFALLKENHRQSENAQGLLYNVVQFGSIHSAEDMVFDDSFEFREMKEADVLEALVGQASEMYRRGESVQVLSPYGQATDLSADKLNPVIRDKVNGAGWGKPEFSYGRKLLREGDRVMITQNNREKNCSNGDLGRFHILKEDRESKSIDFMVQLPDGRSPVWEGEEKLSTISLAYVLTVHKMQGSEVDTILMPLTNDFNNMLYRNLIYTAVSRARKKVILFGSMDALDTAIQRTARPRLSKLVARTQMRLKLVS